MLRIATRARERVKSRGRKRRASVSVIEGAFPIRFPARARARANKQTNKRRVPSSRKKRRKEDKEERCVVSHLFTRDGEHDRADAGRTSYAHSEE